MPRTPAVAVLALVVSLAGCGSGEMSLDEYAERVDEIVGDAYQSWQDLVSSPDGAVLVADAGGLAGFHPSDLGSALERLIEIEEGVLAATAEIDPPDRIEDLHDLLFDSAFTQVERALASRAATAADWAELSATAEMAAYRTALAEDKARCEAFEGHLEGTTGAASFEGMPWVPSGMTEIVEILLDCDGYPDDPAAVYRPPAGG